MLTLALALDGSRAEDGKERAEDLRLLEADLGPAILGTRGASSVASSESLGQSSVVSQ